MSRCGALAWLHGSCGTWHGEGDIHSIHSVLTLAVAPERGLSAHSLTQSRRCISCRLRPQHARACRHVVEIAWLLATSNEPAVHGAVHGAVHAQLLEGMLAHVAGCLVPLRRLLDSVALLDMMTSEAGACVRYICMRYRCMRAFVGGWAGRACMDMPAGLRHAPALAPACSWESVHDPDCTVQRTHAHTCLHAALVARVDLPALRRAWYGCCAGMAAVVRSAPGGVEWCRPVLDERPGQLLIVQASQGPSQGVHAATPPALILELAHSCAQLLISVRSPQRHTAPATVTVTATRFV